MKLTKKDREFIKFAYTEKYYGTNWACLLPEPDRRVQAIKLFPDCMEIKATLEMFNFGKLTYKEYPELYIEFLEEELDRYKSQNSQAYSMMQKVMDLI